MRKAPEEPAQDAVRAHGAAALGGRLRRLSDRIDREAKALYEERGVAFEQRWFPVFNCLRSGEPMSVTDLADRLQVSHVSISVIRSALEKEGLVGSRADERDGRRRVLALTDATCPRNGGAHTQRERQVRRRWVVQGVRLCVGYAGSR